MIIPSFIFWFLEPEWDFWDSAYFVFISVTTIGLGDYVPGDYTKNQTLRNVYKVGVSGKKLHVNQMQYQMGNIEI